MDFIDRRKCETPQLGYDGKFQPDTSENLEEASPENVPVLEMARSKSRAEHREDYKFLPKTLVPNLRLQKYNSSVKKFRKSHSKNKQTKPVGKPKNLEEILANKGTFSLKKFKIMR